MSDFDDWLQWGRELRDDDFARAWMTLGIVFRARGRREGLEQHLRMVAGNSDLAAGAIALDLQQQVLAERGRRTSVAWQFPERPAMAGMLEMAPPPAWAAAWTRVASLGDPDAGGSNGIRVVVVEQPRHETLSAWYSLLLEAEPPADSVRIRMRLSDDAVLFVEWPIRLAALPGNPAEESVARAAAMWPAKRLARVLPVGRDFANSDVLVLSGTHDLVRTALDAARGRLKTDLIVLLGAGPEAVESEDLAEGLLKETHASGIVVLRDLLAPDVLANALNDFVAELSHDRPLDAALLTAFRRAAPDIRPVMRMGDALANFHVSDVIRELDARIKALPPDVTIDLSQVRHADAWRRRDRSLGFKSARKPEATPSHPRAGELEIVADALPFGHESEGGSDLAVVAAAIEAAADTPADDTRPPRFLQQQSHVRDERDTLQPATGGFIRGREARVTVRVGRPDPRWNAATDRLDEDRLPRRYREVRLDVCLTEPTHVKQSTQVSIKLPWQGDSTEGTLTFTPTQTGAFEGRLTVLHRGRVLQTALLIATVRDAATAPTNAGTPRLESPVTVRHSLEDLDARREFDAAFVLNHTRGGVARAVGLARNAASVTDLAPALEIAAAINDELGRVAGAVDDYTDGVTGRKGLDLLISLARHGDRLRIALFDNISPARLKDRMLDAEYIQVVTTRANTVVPFEFVYSYPAPKRDAPLCPHWRESVLRGTCRESCQAASRQVVCPAGFWGLRKVIERHAAVPDDLRRPGQAFLQSEAKRSRPELSLGSVALVALSGRVQDPTPDQLVKAISDRLGAPAVRVGSWTAWQQAVEQKKPRLMLALTHTDGPAHATILEIGNDNLEAIDLDARHIRPTDEDAPPLVALLGCDTTGTADAYGEPIAIFRDRGAAVVIGTIATVFGGHAARVAELLTNELVPQNGATPERLGEAIRNVRRRGLLDNLLVSLAVVAYGDADWRLTH